MNWETRITSVNRNIDRRIESKTEARRWVLWCWTRQNVKTLLIHSTKHNAEIHHDSQPAYAACNKSAMPTANCITMSNFIMFLSTGGSLVMSEHHILLYPTWNLKHPWSSQGSKWDGMQRYGIPALLWSAWNHTATSFWPTAIPVCCKPLNSWKTHCSLCRARKLVSW